MMKKIALIYMGGTFGCIGEPLYPMPAEKFIPLLQQVIPNYLDVECFVAPIIKDSSACSSADWLQLIQLIQQLQLKSFQHFVVIHGTDTLSYASAVLGRFLGQSAYVVLTGSQYPLLNTTGTNTREFTDAIDNLNFALESVLHCSIGVYLAFHHKLLHAATVFKQHTTELDAFSGQLAQENLTLNPKSTTYIVHESDIVQAELFNCVNIMAQPMALQQWENLLQSLSTFPPHVLILQGFGTGNLAINAAVLEKIKQLQSLNCLIVVTTQVPSGCIDQRYAISDWMKDSKIVINDCLSNADLYAKALKIYLQYAHYQERLAHWTES